MKWNLTVSIVVVSAIGVVAGTRCLLASSGFDGVPVAGAQEPQCVGIKSVPYTISRSGLYCLERDLSVEGDGIRIDADSVTVDFKSHMLAGSDASDGIGTGILAVGRNSIRITNGRVSGFGVGIALNGGPGDNSGNHQIDNMTVDGSKLRAILLAGRHNLLASSKILNVGGTGLLRTIHTHGVLVTGPGARIIGNEFREIRGNVLAEKAEGIALALTGDINGALVHRNTFRNASTLDADAGWAGPSPSTYAIWFGGDGLANVTASENKIENFINGIVSDTHVNLTLVANRAVNTIAPFVGRGKFSLSENSGFTGSSDKAPSNVDGPRPAGLFVAFGNACDLPTRNLVIDSVPLPTTCVTDRDVTFDQAMVLSAQRSRVASSVVMVSSRDGSATISK